MHLMDSMPRRVQSFMSERRYEYVATGAGS